MEPMDPVTKAISGSLKFSPLLADDLPSAPVFNRSLLGEPAPGATLNFDQKLGHLYEQALQLLIDASANLTCLASHLQVYDESRRTLGELDFILFDTFARRHIHLELAVKFYLAVPTDKGWSFPGPDPRDNWQRKLDRLEDHQIPLSQRPEAKRLLQERFDIKTIEAQQLIYGRLFHPLECTDSPRLAYMAPDGQTGHWLYVRQWASRFTVDEDFLLIPKPLWPVPLSAETQTLLEPVSADQLINLANERCTMFTLKDSLESWLLVPDNWSETLSLA